MAMSLEEIHLNEKQIAKEILLKLIEDKYINLNLPASYDENSANIKRVNQYFEEILASISKQL